jgi:hypothetical protein
MLNKIFVSFFCFLIISCDLVDQADTDCAGVNFGSAYIDECGVCAAGTTNRIPDDNKDCLGECYGNAEIDECGFCDGSQLAGDCSECDNEGTLADCSGNCPPQDEFDECGVCGGNNDCECPGYPEGTFQDCLGECGGSATVDECNICGGNGIDEDACDCIGNVIDECGECAGEGYVNCICDYIPEGTSTDCSSISYRPYQVGQQLSCEDINTEFSPCYPDCDNSFSLSDFEGRVFWLMYEEDW